LTSVEPTHWLPADSSADRSKSSIRFFRSDSALLQNEFAQGMRADNFRRPARFVSPSATVDVNMLRKKRVPFQSLAVGQRRAHQWTSHLHPVILKVLNDVTRSRKPADATNSILGSLHAKQIASVSN
jgi:hypothetical protein